MDTWVIVTLVVIAVLALAAIAAYWYMEKQRRSEELQRRFGPEYEREVDARGRSKAERELSTRAERVEKLRIRELDPQERQRYGEQWRSVQAHFVDEPAGAIGDADRLCREVMEKRGYPVGDFEQQAADISVDHPEVVSNYRQAHAIAEQHEREGATTEQLRQAMVHYRALFSELLGEVAARP
jgi:hypothetical protein